MRGYFLIIGTLVVVVSGLITLNIFFQQSLQMDMAEQFNNQQLLLSQSIADTIRAHIQFMREEAVSLSHILTRLDLGDSGDYRWLAERVLTHRDSLKANVGVVSHRGEILFYEGDKDVLRTVVPDLVHAAKETGGGRTRILETPSTIYIVASSMQKASREIAFISMEIQTIANTFLSTIKTGSRGYSWMMDKNGNLLYHPTQPGMVGRNLYKTDPTCFKCHISFDLEKRIIEGKANNFGRYIAPSGEDKIIAFSTMGIGDLSWIIAVSAPFSEVTHATRQSMKLYSLLILSIFLTTSLVSTLLIVFNRKRIKAEEVAHRKQELEKYALALENKVAERTIELAEEKEKLDTIVSAIGSGIVLVDRSGIIQWTNQVMKEMAGMDITGKYCEEVCADCTISGAFVENNIETALISNLFGKKDKYYQVTTAPIRGTDGTSHGYIRLVQDVTEMKKMEEQIINSEKLASIGRLAAGIAHEIGNPMTSIFSFVQILREMEDDEFKKESLETIYFHINRISKILKQLSGFSKMPVGEEKSCRINEIIEASLNLIQYDKKAKDVVIIKELDSSLPEITVDGNQLSQVFVNLILNAMDAMQEGGTLTVRSMAKDGDLVIQFEDTGTGIPAEDLSKIFDPFFTTKEKGTGLGLAVSYNIIKKMNGTLSVESEPGGGTTFTIVLKPLRSA
ncbi:MAG: cache domain-containing protein [Alphaproteobacteria bacterium]|uniref:histidine kinase n=1 Tax=Candidatus Nitrobium versatile TaxID=2884831 RepID=A0A953J5N9_9BACT|nr:cache domain-containing protein [Candidatus Nitrobium versatile]